MWTGLKYIYLKKERQLFCSDAQKHMTQEMGFPSCLQLVQETDVAYEVFP